MDLWDSIKSSNVHNYESIEKESELKEAIDFIEKEQLRLLQLKQEGEKYKEIEKGNHGNRDEVNFLAYLDKKLINSDRYIIAFKSLNENRTCTKNMIDASRKMLNHHHGNDYEDLYFVSSFSSVVKCRTDYTKKTKEVMPTKEMKQFVKDNPGLIISIHNHPDSLLPSYDDVKSCFKYHYKYGLIVCHNGSIYQYSTPYDSIDQNIYCLAERIYAGKEEKILYDFWKNKISSENYIKQHTENFIEASAEFLKANVIMKEVLWNDDPKRPRNFKQN